jgi:aspartate carbamoyltransferase catalytic subunit
VRYLSLPGLIDVHVHLPDTIHTLESYADVIVLRHPEVGASEIAAKKEHEGLES